MMQCCCVFSAFDLIADAAPVHPQLSHPITFQDPQLLLELYSAMGQQEAAAELHLQAALELAAGGSDAVAVCLSFGACCGVCCPHRPLLQHQQQARSMHRARMPSSSPPHTSHLALLQAAWPLSQWCSAS
jgi:hypothetical protein